MTEYNELIKRAGIWGASLWKEAKQGWLTRKTQDRNYRSYVIYPAILKIFEEKYKQRSVHLVDLGCGDGSLLEETGITSLIKNGGAYLGVDISPELLDFSRKRFDESNIDFISGDISDPSLPEKIIELGEWNAIASVFVIQEIPDTNAVFSNVAKIGKAGTISIFITVHPDFADWLKANGRMKIANDLEINSLDMQWKKLWRWAGYYPIVDEGCEPFFLPYFHRTVDDYLVLFKEAGFTVDNVMELPDPSSDLPGLVRKNISPFKPFRENLYWPRISEIQSSLCIVARMEPSSENR